MFVFGLAHLTHFWVRFSRAQFFTGWWFLIDAIALYPHSMDAIHVILGILGTISLFMVNSVTQAQLNGDVGYSGGCMEARGARIWIFIGYVLGFAAIIAAIWVMVASFNSSGECYDSLCSVAYYIMGLFVHICRRQDQQLAGRQCAAAKCVHFRVLAGLQVRPCRREWLLKSGHFCGGGMVGLLQFVVAVSCWSARNHKNQFAMCTI